MRIWDADRPKARESKARIDDIEGNAEARLEAAWDMGAKSVADAPRGRMASFGLASPAATADRVASSLIIEPKELRTSLSARIETVERCERFLWGVGAVLGLEGKAEDGLVKLVDAVLLRR